MTAPPPRLHVIPATGCTKALVLRRGPSGQVASLLWDRETDVIEQGQWLKGRIYEHRCDLSPDGRHMVIFAGTGHRWWTALSRAPWLRAIAVFPQSDTWYGGGAFDAEGRLWLNGATAPEEPVPDQLTWARDDAYPSATDGFHMGNLYTAMMIARGWTHVDGTGYDTVLTKPLTRGWHLELRFQLWGKDRSAISNRYALVHEDQSGHVMQQDWEWAEPFGSKLQFAARGALHAAQLSSQGRLKDMRIISDLSDMAFEATAAPYAGIDSRDVVE